MIKHKVNLCHAPTICAFTTTNCPTPTTIAIAKQGTRKDSLTDCVSSGGQKTHNTLPLVFTDKIRIQCHELTAHK